MRSIQSMPERCCTLEAAILLLQEMGAPEYEWATLLECLKVHVDALLIQNKLAGQYGSFSAFECRIMMMQKTLTEKGLRRMQHKRRLAAGIDTSDAGDQ
jgi:hypothetical protein